MGNKATEMNSYPLADVLSHFVREYPETRHVAILEIEGMLRGAFRAGAASTLETPEVEAIINSRIEAEISNRTWRLRSAKKELESLGKQIDSIEYDVKRLKENAAEFIKDVDKLPGVGNA